MTALDAIDARLTDLRGRVAELESLRAALAPASKKATEPPESMAHRRLRFARLLTDQPLTVPMLVAETGLYRHAVYRTLAHKWFERAEKGYRLTAEGRSALTASSSGASGAVASD